MHYCIQNGKVNFLGNELRRGSTLASIAALEAGKAVDWSDGDSSVLRAWKVGDLLFFAHLFDLDIRWPNHVYTFPWNLEGANHSAVCNTSEFLAVGNGIPKADVKGE